MTAVSRLLADALWKIYRRPEQPVPWAHGGNLPWDDPEFSERMLREHLDEAHGAASRQAAERAAQVDWLWRRLGLASGAHLFDVTCGPGLYAVQFARRGCAVTGVDFASAAIDYARDLALSEGVAVLCVFKKQDIRAIEYTGADFDAAILLYGQLAVLKREEAQLVLTNIARSLRVGGKLGVELLNPEHVDKSNSTWWFTDDTGLWGDAPFLHLGERFWNAAEEISVERYQILHLETGRLDEIQLCDQAYAPETMTAMLRAAGFAEVQVFPAWDGLPLYDADEWLVYLATKQA